MGLFDFLGKKDREIDNYKKSNKKMSTRIKELESLCEEKDEHFKKLMSDDLRRGGSLGGKYMADRKKYLKDK